jgi:DNA repair ATPase RecN
MENSKSRAIYITIIILLLISNGVFAYLYFNKGKEVIRITEELINTDNARNELDSLLKQTEAQVAAYKGQNAELDSVIQAKNIELQAQAEKIKVLLSKNQISASELLKVRDEMDALRYYTRKYSSQIDSLAQANELLTQDLKETKTSLNKAKNKIEDLTMENIRKESQLSVASRLRAETIAITGIQNRNSGRERETMRASRVDQVKVQFKIGDNATAAAGDKEVYLRILSPDGATISTSTSGGGQFDYQGSPSMYTQRQRINFKNDQPTITFKYSRGNTEWEKGVYKVELYCEGFVIGVKTFELN